MNRALLALWCVVLFAACLALNTRHNRFPWYYHPDEPGKVEQVIEGSWNFHHPLLLLGATKLAAGGTHDEQEVVEIGRTISAAFIAGAVIALSLLAFAWRGWPAALLSGAVLATHHQLFELSHYFKEDSALLLGLSLTALAAWCYAERPTWPGAACLGSACALAISGKYLGIVSLLLAVPLLVKHGTRRTTPAFALALVVVFVAINWPLFADPGTFRESFGREVELVEKGQGGATQRVPHAEYWAIFRDNTTPAMWVLLPVFLAARWRERRQLPLHAWLLIAFPFVYAIALSFSPKTNDRYFLPATACFSVLAALGANDLRHRAAWPCAAALLIAAQFPGWSDSHPGLLAYHRAFRVDDNAALIEFLQREVPADAVLLKDNRIALPDPERKKHAARVGVVPQKVIAKRFAADAGPFYSLREMGITHVIVSESDYGKFFRASLRPQRGEEDAFARRGEFYTRLFDEAELLWERERGTVIYLHPGISLYRLR